jgi:hypothetical protein
MKNRLVLSVILAFCIALATTARAFESPFKVDTPEYLTLKKMGDNFQLTAEKFGCTKFAWGALVAGGKIADLEYVPAQTAKIDDWKRLMTVTVYSLSGQADTDLTLMNGILKGVLTQYEQAQATILKTEYFHMDNGEPGVFIRYDVGPAGSREHNAGVFMRSGAKTAAFIQIQSRGSDLADADAQAVRALIQPAK